MQLHPDNAINTYLRYAGAQPYPQDMFMASDEDKRWNRRMIEEAIKNSRNIYRWRAKIQTVASTQGTTRSVDIRV